MITIYDNNSDFTAASTQTILNSDSAKHTDSEYNHFAWAAFANIYISQFIFSCDQKSILSNTDSNAQFQSCHTIIWLNKVLWTVELSIWCYSEESIDWLRTSHQGFISCWWLKQFKQIIISWHELLLYW